jgi:hypothetical protein
VSGWCRSDGGTGDGGGVCCVCVCVCVCVCSYHGQNIHDLVHFILLLIQIFIIKRLRPSDHGGGLLLEGCVCECVCVCVRERHDHHGQLNCENLVVWPITYRLSSF